MTRSILLACVTGLLTLTLSTAAFGAALTGSTTDPVGDSTGAADISRVASSYDTGGAWSVTVELASPSTSSSGPGVFASIVNDTAADAPCSGNSSAFATLSGGVGESSFVFFSTNAPGPNNYEGSRHSNAAGTEFTFSKNDPRLAGFGYKCVTLT